MKNIQVFEQFKQAYPKVNILNQAKSELITEQYETIQQVEKHVSHFSINRYLVQPLIQFTPDEVLDLLQTLEKKGYFFSPNPLQLVDISVAMLEDMLNGVKQAKYYPKNVSIGYCLTMEQVFHQQELDEQPLRNFYSFFGPATSAFLEERYNQLTLGTLLNIFVLNAGYLRLGDEPPVPAMIDANQALLARELAKENLKLLVDEDCPQLFALSLFD